MTRLDDSIYDTLSRTLLAGRLPPGTQLVETRLAAVFGASRERVRKVLHRLGHERLLELIPNRGAFVTNPTLDQAREIYEARRILEGGIVARLAGRITPAQLDALKSHSMLEHKALHAGDRARSIHLSGAFHMLLARYTGSPFVERELQELVSRTSMLVAFFEPAAASDCACEEHDAIIGALHDRQAAEAVRAMHAHLSLIETRLRPRVHSVDAINPEHEIARAWERSRRQATTADSRPSKRARPTRARSPMPKRA